MNKWKQNKNTQTNKHITNFPARFLEKKIEMQFLIQANNIVLLKENGREKEEEENEERKNAFSIIGSWIKQIQCGEMKPIENHKFH